MSSPEPDLFRRGQAIFDRLRGASPDEPTEPEAPEDEAVAEASPVEEPPVAEQPESDAEPEPEVGVAVAEPSPEPERVPDPPTVAEIVEEAASNLAPAAESTETPAQAPEGRAAHPASLR